MGEDKKKPGPDAERLVIEGDPAEALAKLLNREKPKKEEPVEEEPTGEADGSEG